ncbi:alpha-(1-_3)-arabinofuranosyltransferase family protein [Pseudofrankia sp. BMG5.36]|uniref:alpha-(1->3)-arabinofuranosyltransferase domain-containing protein n=1 Tax=Pseudofrankia sp. BMG5.36 TaxID=1834512 RepID=UPI0009F51596|nr:alpha-(1->3)-arabinofuranosyltransferase family protein [Pseudofrankia sp. BMG5.36]
MTERTIPNRPIELSLLDERDAHVEDLAPGTASDLAAGGPAGRDRTPRLPSLFVAVGFVVLCLFETPGQIVADTKMDVALDPLRFMERATHLWNSSADFGFLPNQYAGYLFPMGPFFLLGHLLHVPPWITQRLWMALILTVACWGTVRLADALRIGRPLTRVIAGLGYALSPMFIGKVGAASVALTGAAMLPWITLPLVLALRPDGAAGAGAGTAGLAPGAARGDGRDSRLSPRRAAALSGLAVFCTGGVNASVTLCVLLFPAVLLVCAGGTRRAWALRAWWTLSVILACFWWLCMLVVQSRYGLNFLPFTETAATTTATTSVAEALRGTTDWLAYLRLSGPWLPAASATITNPVAVAGSVAATGIGLWGLARRDLPARRVLVISLAAGVVAVSAAYPGQPGSPLADGVQQLLAGQLAFLRNVYKFQPVAHLPLALGMAHALHVALGARRPSPKPQPERRHRSERPAARPAASSSAGAARRADPLSVGAVVLTVAALVMGMAPAYTGQFFQSGTFQEVPDYWHEAADWLADNPDGGRTLMLPAMPFGEYSWGRPLDEPMSWLASTPWASRALVPLGNTGMTRWMDGIDQQLELGQAPGLAVALARAGVGQVLIRNDLDDRNWDIPPSTDQVHRALEGSGLRRAASFGPMINARLSSKGRLIPSAAMTRKEKVPALEVWVVPGHASEVAAYPVDTAVVVSGGAEATVQLAAHGIVGTDRAVVLASDLAGTAGAGGSAASSGGLNQAPPASEVVGPTTALVVTDTSQRRDTDFGVVHNGTSYLLGPNENAAGRSDAPRQWLDQSAAGHQTVAGYTDGVRIRASSFGSNLIALPDTSPAAAFDGFPYTSWTAAPDKKKGSTGAWVEADLPRATTLPYIDVQLLEEGTWRPAVQAIRVTSQAGSVVTRVSPVETAQRLKVPAGPSSWFRITFEQVTRQQSNVFGAGIRELTLPGVRIQHYAQTPSDAASLFTGGEGQLAYTFDRMGVDVTDLFGGSEELALARRFDVPRPMNFTLTGSMTAVPILSEAPPDPTAPFVVPCGGGPSLSVDGVRYDVRVEGLMSDVAKSRPMRMSVCTPDGTIPLTAGQHLITTDSAGLPLLTGQLTLVGTGTRTSGDKPRSTTVTSWTPERRTVEIGAGTRAFLVVRENANSSWTATLNGQALTPVRLDGWQQGWIVPAGSAGTVLIENHPGQSARGLLVVGGILLLLLVALVLIPARWRFRRSVDPDGYPLGLGRGKAPLASRRARVVGGVAGGVFAVIAVFLVAGPVAVIVLVLVLAGRRRPTVLPWTAFVFAVLAGVGVALEPDAIPGSGDGAFSWQVQAAGVVAFAAVVAALTPRPADATTGSEGRRAGGDAPATRSPVEDGRRGHPGE